MTSPSAAGARPILACFELKDWERVALEERFPDADLRWSPEPLGSESIALAADADVLSCFLRSYVGAEQLAQMPRLRLIATRSTGFDHIDLVACRERGVAAANVPYYGENTVAEHTFGLILSLSRKIHQAYMRTAAGNFSLEGLTGFDLKGKTLGVVGAGSIGLHVIRIGRGFGMDVVAYDAREQHLLAEVLGFTYLPLEEVLRRADVLSLHVPALPETHHLINRERLALAKRGAVLINTSRGTVVDTEALLWALDEGILSGAGLDVLEGEEYLEDEMQVLAAPSIHKTLRAVVLSRKLLQRPDVIFTPHLAFNSREALRRILDTTADNIAAFLAGRPRNLVTGSPGGQPG